MTEQELREKIVKILEEYRDWFIEEDYKRDIAKIDYTGIADALIAAGIGDVKDLQEQVDSLEMTNIALQAGYDGAEKDRLYWVDKYKEAEHRAEVAEKQVKILSEWFSVECKDPKHTAKAWRDVTYLQAEKELEEERK